MTQQPILIREGIIKIGNQTIGLARSIEITEERESIEVPVWGSETPIRAVTLKRASFRIERLYVKNDSLLRENYNQGTSFDMIILPEGEGSGKEKWTLKDVLLTRLVKTAETSRFIEEAASGTAREAQYEITP